MKSAASEDLHSLLATRNVERVAQYRRRMVRTRLLMLVVFPIGGALIAAGVSWLVGEDELVLLLLTSVVAFAVSCLSGFLLMKAAYPEEDQ